MQYLATCAMAIAGTNAWNQYQPRSSYGYGASSYGRGYAAPSRSYGGYGGYGGYGSYGSYSQPATSYGYGQRQSYGHQSQSHDSHSSHAVTSSHKDVDVSNSNYSVHITHQGSGEAVKAGDKIKAHYHGTLLNGTKFDSSYERGQPFDFTVGEGKVIKCWDEAFKGLSVGTKADIVCQPGYGYGAAGMGETIPGNSVLQFTIEVVGIDKPEASHNVFGLGRSYGRSAAYGSGFSRPQSYGSKTPSYGRSRSSYGGSSRRSYGGYNRGYGDYGLGDTGYGAGSFW